MHPEFTRGYSEVMIKVGALSEQDIASALAGSPSRDISDEEIAEYAAKLKGDYLGRTKKYPATGAGVLGILGTGAGALAGGLASKSKLKGVGIGAGIGALTGAGLGAGLGALTRHQGAGRESRWGTALGEIAQEGRVPRRMPMGKHEDLLPFATGIREETAQPLSPNEYANLRQQLIEELKTEAGADSDMAGDSRFGQGLGQMGALDQARQQASSASDLYERGYGHLAGRVLERQ